MYFSAVWAVFASSLTINMGRASAVEIIKNSISLKSLTAPAHIQTPETPPQVGGSDSAFRGALMSFSASTSPSPAVPLVLSTVIPPSTTSPANETSASVFESNLGQLTMAVSTTSSGGIISPEVGETVVGSPVGFTTPFSPSQPSSTAPLSDSAVIGDSSGISSADPTTLVTETSSASATLESATWIETTSTVASEASPSESTVSSHHSSLHALTGPGKIAAIVVPITVILLIVLAFMIWWFLTRRKERKRVDRLAAKAVWMDQGYIDSIRQKMMGIDEEKVSNSNGSPETSPLSKLTAVRRSNPLNMGKRLSAISDSIPGIRRTSKRISRAEYLEMAQARHDAKIAHAEDAPDISVVHKADKEIHGQDKPEEMPDHVDAYDVNTFASGALPSTTTRQSMIELPSAAMHGSGMDAADMELLGGTGHRRSASTVSKLGRHVERAIRRRSGVEELRG